MASQISISANSSSFSGTKAENELYDCANEVRLKIMRAITRVLIVSDAHKLLAKWLEIISLLYGMKNKKIVWNKDQRK